MPSREAESAGALQPDRRGQVAPTEHRQGHQPAGHGDQQEQRGIGNGIRPGIDELLQVEVAERGHLGEPRHVRREHRDDVREVHRDEYAGGESTGSSPVEQDDRQERRDSGHRKSEHRRVDAPEHEPVHREVGLDEQVDDPDRRDRDSGKDRHRDDLGTDRGCQILDA